MITLEHCSIKKTPTRILIKNSKITDGYYPLFCKQMYLLIELQKQFISYFLKSSPSASFHENVYLYHTSYIDPNLINFSSFPGIYLKQCVDRSN